MFFEKLAKIKKEKIKRIAFKAVLLMIRHAFLACLVLLLFVLAYGAHFFYNIKILSDITEFEELNQYFFLDRVAYNKALECWEEDDLRFKQANLKEYPDPFNAAVEEVEEEEDLID